MLDNQFIEDTKDIDINLIGMSHINYTVTKPV